MCDEKRIDETIQLHKSLLARFETTGPKQIKKAAQLIIESIKNGGCTYICGNGGSAADAQHIAAELVGRLFRTRKALPAVALTTDTSILTAVGNDFSMDYIFQRQIEALVKPTDVVWAFSTSGTSKNILKAVDAAKQRNAKILAFTGKTDSPLEKLSDVCVCVPAPTASSAQEIHQLAYHMICDLVETHFAD